MTEQNSNDKPLNAYLTGKTTLSDAYQQLPADEPRVDTDVTILAAAKRETNAKRRHQRWTIPSAIAAMLVIGVSLLWWQQNKTPDLLSNKESAAPAQEKTLPQQVDSTLHQNPVADRWLEQILKLHQAGKTTQAAAEFKKFREAYPAYSMDMDRFAALQQYDK